MSPKESILAAQLMNKSNLNDAEEETLSKLFRKYVGVPIAHDTAEELRRMSIAGSVWEYVGTGAIITSTSGNLTLSTVSIEDISEGNILVACIGYKDTPQFTVPYGWTLIDQETSGDDNFGENAIASALMAWTVRGASDPDLTFTRTAGGVARGAIVAYKIPETVSVQASSSSTDPTSTITHVTPGLTVADNTLLVAMCAHPRNITINAFDAAIDPAIVSGFTDDEEPNPKIGEWEARHDSGTTTGSDIRVAISDAIKELAGDTGQFSCISGNAARAAMIVAAFKATP